MLVIEATEDEGAGLAKLPPASSMTGMACWKQATTADTYFRNPANLGASRRIASVSIRISF